jgi:hypothetical protein
MLREYDDYSFWAFETRFGDFLYEAVARINLPFIYPGVHPRFLPELRGESPEKALLILARMAYEDLRIDVTSPHDRRYSTSRPVHQALTLAGCNGCGDLQHSYGPSASAIASPRSSCSFRTEVKCAGGYTCTSARRFICRCVAPAHGRASERSLLSSQALVERTAGHPAWRSKPPTRAAARS